MAAELPDAYFDGIFVSNFLEHLGGQEQVYEFLVRMYEVTAEGGRIAILGPNFRYTAKEYFDYADHIVVLTHLAVAEHLHTAGYKVDLERRALFALLVHRPAAGLRGPDPRLPEHAARLARSSASSSWWSASADRLGARQRSSSA